MPEPEDKPDVGLEQAPSVATEVEVKEEKGADLLLSALEPGASANEDDDHDDDEIQSPNQSLEEQRPASSDTVKSDDKSSSKERKVSGIRLVAT